MNKKQELFAVTAICLSIIIAGAIIAYKPGAVQTTPSLPTGFRYPSGIDTSTASYSDISQGTTPTPKTISLTGSGTSSARADQATVELGVTVTDESANTAIRLNAERMTAVIEAIKNTGINEEDIATISYSVYPQYDYTDTGRVLRGYAATNIVRVKVMNLDLVGTIIDEAAAAGSNQINGIAFELSDSKREELKANAYVAALTDAQEKADVIAMTLGLTITGVQSVAETSYTPARNYDNAPLPSGATDSSTPVLSGELSVTVRVSIVFQFE